MLLLKAIFRVVFAEIAGAGRQHICDNTIGIGVNRDGGFAEYISVPAKNVLHIDQRISDEMMAIMDPLGNATHTALSFPMLGEDVLITGIGGPIGAMAAAICKFAGARNIIGTDLSKYRRDLARKWVLHVLSILPKKALKKP